LKWGLWHGRNNMRKKEVKKKGENKPAQIEQSSRETWLTQWDEVRETISGMASRGGERKVGVIL